MTFPGTVASLRQMWGRAGRRGRGLAVYVAGDDALDQFFCRHPDEFLDRPVEAAILDPFNEQIHAGHVLCAAHEGPLEPADARVPRRRRRARAHRGAARGDGRAAPAAGRDVGAARRGSFPAGEVSLRSTTRDGFTIVDLAQGELLGTVDARARVQHDPPGRGLPARRARVRGRGARPRARGARSCGRSRATGTRRPSARPTCTSRGSTTAASGSA